MLWDRSTFWRKPERSNSETDPTRSCLSGGFSKGDFWVPQWVCKGRSQSTRTCHSCVNKNIGLQQKSTLFSYPTHLWYMEISWKEMLCSEKWEIYHSLAGEGAPKEGKKEKGASSSTASECCQLVLELECIPSASTNILQQSLFGCFFLVLRTHL